MYCLQARLFSWVEKDFNVFFALVLLDMARGKFECWLQTFFLLPKVHTHTCSYVYYKMYILNIIFCDVSPLPTLQLKVPKIFNWF